MRQDWWKWTAAFMAGLAIATVSTQIGWFIAFEKDAATREDLAQQMLVMQNEYRAANLVTRQEMQAISGDLQRTQAALRIQVDQMQRDISDFKTESVSDRRALAVKLDLILQLLTGKVTKDIPWPEPS